MDYSDEQYDPDGDVSRFLGSPDLHERPVISSPPSLPQEALQPMPLLPQEPLQQTPPLLPQGTLQPTPLLLHHEVLQQAPQLMPHEALQHAPSLLPRALLQPTTLLLPQEALQQTPPLLPQEAFQQAPPLLPHHVTEPLSVEGFDGTNAVPATTNMEAEVTEPLSVEGVIIAAMEGIQIEGSSSTNPVNDALYEPVFLQHAPGDRDCSGCIPLREVSHSSPNRNLIFSIHGGIGTFDHAVFDVEYFQRDGSPPTRESFYVE